MTTQTLPQAFIWRRLHSLTGLWIVLFLIEHLLTNSQAALLLGDNGRGFISMVNWLHNLPYLQVIELTLLGVPILVHLVWGLKYLFSAKANSYGLGRSQPTLPEYGRNRAYTWQRITSWVLLFCLIGHVAKFRFLDYPESLNQGVHSYYFVRVSVDNGLYTVADRLGVSLYDAEAVQKEKDRFHNRSSEAALTEIAHSYQSQPGQTDYDAQKAIILQSAQKFEQKKQWVDMLSSKPLKKGEVVAVSENFGTATLLTVRDTFKNPIYVGAYTIFVLAACFHAFNGLWTFLITWGLILRAVAQRKMASFAIGLMVLIALLGLISIWGTYWLNLKT